MANTSLVVSGGGAKGAFAVGVLDYLNTNNMLPDFDFYVGTSTGALICPLMATGGLLTLIDIYASTSDTDFARARDFPTAIVQNDSLFDPTPLWTLIQKTITQDIADQLLGGPKTVLIATISMQSGKTVYFQAGPGPVTLPQNSQVFQLQKRDELMLAMLASSCQPGFMPLISVMPDRDPGSQYCDGGVKSVAPMEVALASGAQSVYGILLYPSPPIPVQKNFTSFLDILRRSLDLFSDAVGEDNIQISKSLAEKRGATLKIVQPTEDLMGFGLTFSPVQMAQMMQKGRARAAELFPLNA